MFFKKKKKRGDGVKLMKGLLRLLTIDPLSPMTGSHTEKQ